MFLSGGYASDAYATGMKRLILVLAVIVLVLAGVLPWWLGVALVPVIVVLTRPRGAMPAVSAPVVRVGERREPWFPPDARPDADGRMFGVPGGGLASAAGVFGAERVDAGVEGETRLARLVASRLPSGPLVFLSLKTPGMGDVDVDCAVLDGRVLWLLDAKMWTFEPGCAWTRYGASDEGVMLLRRVDAEGRVSGDVVAERRLSRSMIMARDAYRRLFPGLDVRACTLLTPTDRGVAGVAADAVTPQGSRLETVYSWLDMFGRLGHAAPDMRAARRLEGLLNG